MKALLILFSFLFWLDLTPNRVQAATVLVRMTRENTFDPRDITINVGDTVTWTNVFVTRHDSVSSAAVWASPLLSFRQIYSRTFDTPGRFEYFCTPHIDVGMFGSVTVSGGVNNPPTAQIISPTNNTTFQATDTIQVVASASDDGAVAKVELVVDVSVIQAITAPPYQFSLSLAPGSHSLAVRATDDQGLTFLSAAIAILVAPSNQPPTVTIPLLNGAIFAAPATVAISANANDDSGVTRVEFRVNGELAGEDLVAPFILNQTFSAGTYTVTARAFDAAGLSALSEPATFEVRDPLPEFPAASIIAPNANIYLPYTTLFTIEARVSDNSAITNVLFFDGTNALSGLPRMSEIPRPGGFEAVYALDAPLSEGAHSVTVRATDDLGNSTTSNPVTFTLALRPTFTTKPNLLTNGVVRLSVFGTSSLPFVFEHSEDLVTWTPFLTNLLYRRVLFFDDTNAANRPLRLYRVRSPSPAP